MAAIEFEPRAADRSLKRLEILLYVVLVWALVLGGRLVYLQVLSHDEFARLAQRQQQREEQIQAHRGDIFDRSGSPLAVTVPAKSVVLDTRRLKGNHVLTVELLGRFLSLDTKELAGRIEEGIAHRNGFLRIKRKVSVDEAQSITNLRLAGVSVVDDPLRTYPKGRLAAHVIGGVDHEGKGNAGVELAMEKELKGIPGSAVLLQDVRRQGLDAQVEKYAQPGRNLMLTIDERVQYAAEEALKDAVAGCRCKSGSIVVLEPGTGDVLALANYPTYDPNAPPGGESPARLNLAVTGAYEPGSVFKLITLASALEKTGLRPDSPINCLGGQITLAGRTIHEAKGGFGVIPMRTVLAKSSNVGAIQVALAMGSRKLYESIRAFGFGTKTGIELPAESNGIVRRLENWGRTSIGSVAMGHEIMTTSLQLARAGAVLANDGMMINPRLVRAWQAPGGEWERQAPARPERVISARNAALMRDMMRDVVRKGGTGVSAKLLGYETGGKTGSAQMLDEKTHRYLHGKYNASFLGIAPLNKPAVVVVVTLTGSSEYGGKVAAPVFNKVASAAMRVLDVPMDDRESIEEEQPAEEDLNDVAAVVEGPAEEAAPAEERLQVASLGLEGGLRAPDFLGRSLREVLAESAASGIAVETRGKGVSRVQRPPPGDPMRPGQTILVQFGK
jgi:cell division protein FtsI (penicillin-binding protein 3)